MGVYWCHNYRWGATNPTNIVLPAKASLPSFSSCNMYHVEPGCIFHMKQNGSKAIKQFTFDSFLAQCGDIESNPGPKREPKPDKAKIMQDKVSFIAHLYSIYVSVSALNLRACNFIYLSLHNRFSFWSKVVSISIVSEENKRNFECIHYIRPVQLY